MSTSNKSKLNKGERKPNRLIAEKSPYLLQHAFNPVDWYPWGSEAFDRARKENKPIFLSIGYSTCHWCHVMEKESFEDPDIARMMNEAFICIKVDREERPDIDSIYMTVCQMMTGSGGWPLTIIMTPDKKPFFAATYIPKQSRWGRPGMMELIPRIKELWKSNKDEVMSSAEQITQHLRQTAIHPEGEPLGESALEMAYRRLSRIFDERYGGFGSAPKFPTPHNLTFLLRYWKRTGEQKALRMVEKTLQSMRLGGIYDHVGFGFHRYSTDSRWLVPHFEKMLYDQALLVMAYTEAYQATGKEEYRHTVREILDYVVRDMTAPEGGFYSAEDAESEGEEGKFYLWTEEEIRQLLPGEESDLLIRIFNIEKDGNFAEETTGRRTGSNILYLRKSLHETASDMKISPEELERNFQSARQKLFAARRKRVHPHKDDKILTDWNGLMMAALARASGALDEPQYAEAARRTADFILTRMRDSKGRLYHRYRDGETAIPAFLDDYAFLAWGLIELYEATFEIAYLRTALDLNTSMLRHFWDERSGGLYSTADDSESLLVRQKEIYNGAMPSGNSAAMLNLLRLARMTANSELEEKAAQIGRVFSSSVLQSPASHTQLMAALDFAVGPTYEVVIAGNSQADDTTHMLRALRKEFIPNKVVLLRPTEVELPEIARLAEFTKYLSSKEGKATAYVCQNYSCKLPTTDIGKMLELLDVSYRKD